jgi:hypothetical protein
MLVIDDTQQMKVKVAFKMAKPTLCVGVDCALRLLSASICITDYQMAGK